MAELLLELLSEEIPARMQARAAEDLKRLVTKGLEEAGLAHGEARAFVTPRRLALVVGDLPERQPDRRTERKGPRVGAPEKAIRGFLAANGLDSLDQCETREVNGKAFYFAVREIPGRATAEVLPPLVAAAINALRWPKSMRWGHTVFTWVRPLHGILAVFAGKPLQYAFGLGHRGGEVVGPQSGRERVISFGDQTRGHRFLAPGPIRVQDFADYESKLREAKVVLDREERKQIIAKAAVRLADNEGLVVQDDPALLDEVAGLVEWPEVRMGRIDEAYMAVPEEVLVTAMRHHQKYFALRTPDGRLAPRFMVVINTVTDDDCRTIVAGNERVLRARLADAKFFWDQDRKTPLEDRRAALDGIVFHEKLGTLGDKARRIEKLALFLAEAIPGADEARVRHAARLAKADLTTEMVGEFPELQGVMGRHYAFAEGLPPAVADAIAEHYSPAGPDDACPTSPVSVAVALADRIDTLVGFFAIGETPTGSRDPFALRRAALGAIRLIVENGLRLSLRQVFEKAWVYWSFPSEGADRDTLNAVWGSLFAFFVDRLKVHLRGRGVRHDHIEAVFALGGEDDLVRLLARVRALQAFLASDDGADLLVAYRRAANIVRIEEKKDKKRYDSSPNEAMFAEAEEEALYRALERVREEARRAIKAEDFEAAMAALAALRGPVDRFFDRVTVNCEDPALRENRLRLLAEIQATMNTVADFSCIEG